MDRASGIFWGSVLILFALSIFYGVGVQREMGRLQGAQGKIENGAVVKLVRVVDGDAVVVEQEGRGPSNVRILGVKSFDSKIGKDVVTPYSQAAKKTLERLMSDKPVRIMLHTTTKDRYGRYIASFYAEDQDVGLRLIKEGFVLVYTVYPFPAMSLYLEEQEMAKKARRGLWANADAVNRAMGLIGEWQRRTR